jgi:VCBS repeat-containing protein/predicted outer membrane repeat protein
MRQNDQHSFVRFFIGLAIVFILILSLTTPQFANAATTILYATPTGLTSGSCNSWATACDLQYALSIAIVDTEIWVAAGTYYPTTGIDRTVSFALKNGVALYGGFVGTETNRNARDWVANTSTLSGEIGDVNITTDNSYHVVVGTGTAPSAVLDGFTITAGSANNFPVEYNGGGMYNSGGSPTVVNVIFTANFAVDDGGGMYNSASSSPTLNNVQFMGNSTDYNGGGLYNNNSSPILSNVSFTDNTAGEFGGGMYNYNLSNPTLTTVTFSGNKANTGGGGMINDNSSPILTDVTFDSNAATTSGFGGGMFNQANSAPSLSNVSFISNDAYYGGGMSNSGSVPSLLGVSFTSNTATRGGGIYNTASSPSLTNVTFDLNDAVNYGGGMCNTALSNPTLSGVNFTANLANYGAGIYNNNSSPTLETVTFDSNVTSASGNGAGMYNVVNSHPSLAGVTFNNNNGRFGAGMYNDASSPTLTDVAFTYNTGEEGGGIYNNNLSNPELDNVSFEMNIVTLYGGGICNINSSPILRSVTFTSNTATQHGGGMYNASGSAPQLADVTFSQNTANQYGGGMYIHSSTPTLVNVDFSGNHADNFGGGLYLQLSSPSLANVRLMNNTANMGGGIYNSSSYPTLVNTTFYANSVTGQGGGMYNTASNPTIYNTIMWANTPNQVNNVGSSPVINYSDIQGGCPSGSSCPVIISSDPLFVNPGASDLSLKITSPAIDAGNNTLVPADVLDLDQDLNTAEPLPYDLSGNPRFVDDLAVTDTGVGPAPVVDMGVYERGDLAPVAVNDSYTTNESTLLSVAVPGVLGNDSDPNGDTLTAVLDTDVTHGTLTLNSNGSFNYTPVAQYHGSDSFTYHATDGWLGSTIATVNLTITSINDPPVLAPIGNKSGDEKTLITFTATATDPDLPPDILTFSLEAGAPSGASINPTTGVFTWTPTEAQGPGVYPVTVRVTDNGTPPLYDSETIQITVNDVNEAPVLAAIGNKSGNELTLITFTATATDPDIPANTLIFSLDVGAPTGASINPTTGVFTWTPTEAQGPGVYPVTVRVTDNGTPAMSDFETIQITANEVNLPPVLAAIGNKSGSEHTLITFTATATDPDLPANILTFGLDVGAPSGASINPTTGVFTWTPSEAQGPGVYPVTVRVADNGTPSMSDFETIEITVNEVNDAPVAVDDSYSTDEDTPLVVDAPGVLDNDTDPENGTLTAVLNLGPAHGDLTFLVDGSFVYTPTLDYNGTDTFTYHANDGELNSNIATVTITINPINDAPVAVADSYTVGQDATLDVDAPGVLSNDTDPEDDELTAVLDQDPQHGLLELDESGAFTYVPDPGYFGTDTFTYHANDGELDSNTVTVTISIVRTLFRFFLPLIHR